MSDCKHEFVKYEFQQIANDFYCKHCEFEPNEEYLKLQAKMDKDKQEFRDWCVTMAGEAAFNKMKEAEEALHCVIQKIDGTYPELVITYGDAENE